MQNAPSIVLIKTSSLGDVLHNLPVVSDICKHLPGARIDWVIEESFASLPALHPGVKEIIPVAIRRWRKSLWQSRGEVQTACSKLRASHYDIALDTQGLIKSALITRCIPATRCGFDRNSAREPVACLFYDHTYFVAKNQHAVERNRQLAGQVLGYTPQGEPDYGIQAPILDLPWLPSEPYAVLLHATSRDEKLWAEENWIVLGKRLNQMGMRLILPWGNTVERTRSERLCETIPGAICPSSTGLKEAAAVLGQASAVIGVDTGLTHLAAAFGIPTVGIYTATDPGLTGLHAGKNAINLGGKQQPPSVEAVLVALRQAGLHD